MKGSDLFSNESDTLSGIAIAAIGNIVLIPIYGTEGAVAATAACSTEKVKYGKYGILSKLSRPLS